MNRGEAQGHGAADAMPFERGLWRFGVAEFDERQMLLKVAGASVAIENKPLELLSVLLRHADEVVTKDELLEHVWPGRVASESVLTKAMAKLRSALGDDEQTLIKTVYGFGYRLVADVRLERGPATPLPTTVLAIGDRPPLRPHWVLERALGGGRGDVWLSRNEKTGERRVFKFAHDGESLRGLKREITLFRVLIESLGNREDFVRLLDWNLDEAPFFVESEYSNGGNLNDWIEAQGGFDAVALEQRLQWVRQAADGLAAAHEAGVLHKDVKPANVLVDQRSDGRTVVKLADFGSGKMLDPARVRDLSITQLGFTQTRTLDASEGTPLYLAPELIAGQPPTARSDVYALGVVLFQMVVGDFRRVLAPGWERDVHDDLLREDIAACCDHDPANRLASAAVLAERLRQLPERRLLQQQTEQQYREMAQLQWQFDRAQARRGLWRLLSAVLAVAVVAISVLLWQLQQRSEQTAMALQRAQTISDFLQQDLLAAANPDITGRKDMTVRELLSSVSEQVDTRFARQPRQLADIRRTLANSWDGVGEIDRAIEENRHALALLKTLPDDTREERYDIESHVAHLLALDSRFSDAELIARDFMQEIANDQSPSATIYREKMRAFLPYLVIRQARDVEQNLVLLAHLHQRAKSEFGRSDERTLYIGKILAEAYSEAGRLAESDDVYRQNMDARQAIGLNDATTRNMVGEWAAVLMEMGQDERALPLAQRSYDDALNLYGIGKQHTLFNGNTLAIVLQHLGQFDQAQTLYEFLLDNARHNLGDEHLETITISDNLATLYADRAQHQKALDIYLHNNAIMVAKKDDGLARRIQSNHINLARTLQDMNRWQASLPWAAKSFAPGTDPDDAHTHYGRCVYARSLRKAGNAREGDAVFDRCIPAVEAVFGSDHPVTARVKGWREESLE